VSWEDLASADASWEPLEDFKERYPEFKLEDELFNQAGGSVMDSMFGKQFRHRTKKQQAPASG
jgi:transcriptional regulator GlxA family with amidase domain